MARIAVLLTLVFAPLLAISQGAPSDQTIRVSTHLVQINIIARDKNGPVPNLTKDDFVVTDEHVTRPIGVFSVESAKFMHEPVQPLPPNTFSDLPQYGTSFPNSVTIVLLDNLNTLTGTAPVPYEETSPWLEDHALANAKAHLIEFIRGMDPGERVAIYSLRDSLRVRCDFTGDRNELLAILEHYDASSKTERETVNPAPIHTPVPGAFNSEVDRQRASLAALANQNRAETTMAALQSIAAHVADIPGRKNLIWLTANLPFSAPAIAAVLNRAHIAVYPVDGRGLLPRNDMKSLREGVDADALGAARPALDPAPEPVGIGTMEKLAEETGGEAFVNTNDLTGAVRKAVEDSAITYTLGFYVDAGSLDGKFHKLKVQVERKGVNLRYPDGYFAIKDAPASVGQSQAALLSAIRSPLESSVIPVQVKVARVEQPLPHSLLLSSSIDIHALRLTQSGDARTGAVDVVLLEQDKTGKVLHQSTSRINLRFREKQYEDCLKSGVQFGQDVQPRDGTTTLRIMVEDSGTAELGSLIIPLAEIK